MEKIEFLSAILVISKDTDRLSEFYRDVVGLPLTVEERFFVLCYAREAMRVTAKSRKNHTW